MVAQANIKPRAGFNPRRDFAKEQMAELVESVRQHGIISPLTLAPRRRGRVHDHRRRAPLPRGEGGETKRGTGAGARRGATGADAGPAENVMRADLNPVEE